MEGLANNQDQHIHFVISIICYITLQHMYIIYIYIHNYIHIFFYVVYINLHQNYLCKRAGNAWPGLWMIEIGYQWTHRIISRHSIL